MGKTQASVRQREDKYNALPRACGGGPLSGMGEGAERSFELLRTWPLSERGQMLQPLLVSCVPALGNPLGPSQET